MVRKRKYNDFNIETVDEIVFAKRLDQLLSIHHDLRILYREALAQGIDTTSIISEMKKIAGRVFKNKKTNMIMKTKYRGRTESVFTYYL